MAQTEVTDRLRGLVEAGIAVSSELSLDGVLQRIAEAASTLTGAPYAALGVIDRSGTQLERFVAHGIPKERHPEIGELPRGRGILGVLINDARPLRLDDIADDPRSVGFPSEHPPMRSFLGVPIMLRGVAYGNLYLTEKPGGFTEEDEELVTLLAAQAAVAVENARLYESATRWSQQLESLNEIGYALIAELELEPLLDLIATSLRTLLECRIVLIALPDSDDRMRIRAVSGEGTAVGSTFARYTSKGGRVLERGLSERVDELLDDPEVDQERIRRSGARTGLFVPLRVRDRSIGIVVAHDKLTAASKHFSDDDLRLAEQFAVRAAIAVDLSERIQRDSLRRVLGGQELERRRLARELHDETGQALTSILLGLKSVEETRETPAFADAVAHLRELILATLHDVRRLAIELRPKALDDFGLVPALERLVHTFRERTGIPVQLAAHLGEERLADDIETTLYRLVQEALTNIVKHAHARHVSVLLVRRRDRVSAVIEDDGQGFDHSSLQEDGLGLVGMRERIGLVGGRLSVESSEDGGTTIAVEVPLR
jgi:signal transduction histidine kinase